MSIIFNLLVILSLLTVQSCHLLVHRQPVPSKSLTGIRKQQNQLFHLFNQAERYGKLSKIEKMTVCEQLKRNYQQQKNWQTAWLLVYSLNHDFNCISLKKTLDLLKGIQSNQRLNPVLHGLNNDQIKLLNNLSILQAKNSLFRTKNNKLTKQLIETKAKLKNITNKIQELKIIETTINKKTR